MDSRPKPLNSMSDSEEEFDASVRSSDEEFENDINSPLLGENARKKEDEKYEESANGTKTKWPEYELSRSGFAPNVLNKQQKIFSELVEAGRVELVKDFLEKHKDFSINYIDHQGLSPLHLAVNTQHQEMVLLMLDHGAQILDCHFTAIKVGNKNALEILLDRLGPDEFSGCKVPTSSIQEDITPIILAAQMGNYEVVRFLLDRGHKLEKPHHPTCVCRSCKRLMKEGGYYFSEYRLHVYQAIANPAFLLQMAKDPIGYAFHLDRELQECAEVDIEYAKEYKKLSEEVRKLPVDLLAQCRNISEVEIILRFVGNNEYSPRIILPRLVQAVEFEQKEFIADPKVQQVIRSNWLGTMSVWPRIGFFEKALRIALRFFLLPVTLAGQMIMPHHRCMRRWQSPHDKYLNTVVSYIVFQILVLTFLFLDTGREEGGMPHTGLEIPIICFVAGYIKSCIQLCWSQGVIRYFFSLWNWYDLAMLLTYFCAIVLWFVSEYADPPEARAPPRIHWKDYNLTLIHEGVFVLATLLSFGRLMFFFNVNSAIGPFWVSFTKMTPTIFYFLVAFGLIMLDFSIGMTKLYYPYHGMRSGVVSQPTEFTRFPKSFYSYFWAMFTMTEGTSAQIVVAGKKGATHRFTEGVGYLMFSAFEVIMVIVLMNVLIAVLLSTFDDVIKNADEEWKFARTRLYMLYFYEVKTIPSPFNLIPNIRSLAIIPYWIKLLTGTHPYESIKCSKQKCCYIEYNRYRTAEEYRYENLLSYLVKRYWRAKEESPSEKGS